MTTPDAESAYGAGAKAGDPYAALASGFGSTNPSTTTKMSRDNLFAYLLTKYGAQDTPDGLMYSPAQAAKAAAEYRDVRSQLAQLYVSNLKTNGFADFDHIWAWHVDVYGKHGIPMSRFGGTIGSGSETIARWTYPAWCRGCR